MNDIEDIPRKAVYQIYLTDKSGKILLDKKTIAFNESEAIKKVKVGGTLKELKLTRDKVDFFIRVAGHLYEGETFAEPLSEVMTLTTDEKVFDKVADIETRVAALEKLQKVTK